MARARNHKRREVEMPDERQDSIRQGIGVPPESPTGRRAEDDRRRSAAGGPEIGGAMGGTSDSDSAGDEASRDAAMHATERETGPEEDLAHRERTREETGEAEQRVQGGGAAEESDIRRAVDEGRPGR